MTNSCFYFEVRYSINVNGQTEIMNHLHLDFNELIASKSIQLFRSYDAIDRYT